MGGKWYRNLHFLVCKQWETVTIATDLNDANKKFNWEIENYRTMRKILQKGKDLSKILAGMKEPLIGFDTHVKPQPLLIKVATAQ